MASIGSISTNSERAGMKSSSRRWFQLLLGFIVMMTISSPQYVWTLFTGPLQKTTGSLLSDVQWTITILIVLQTWLSPVQGWLVDKIWAQVADRGRRSAERSWLGCDVLCDDLWGLYATYGLLCGIGTGIVYIGIIGLMVKWFPERRGFATGVVAAGYGFGAILTTFPIDDMMKASGYQQTLFVFGIIFAAVGLSAPHCSRPQEGEVAVQALLRGEVAQRSYEPGDAEDTGVLAAVRMMSMMSTGGLMVITQFTSFAKSFGIDAKQRS